MVERAYAYAIQIWMALLSKQYYQLQHPQLSSEMAKHVKETAACCMNLHAQKLVPCSEVGAVVDPRQCLGCWVSPRALCSWLMIEQHSK